MTSIIIYLGLKLINSPLYLSMNMHQNFIQKVCYKSKNIIMVNKMKWNKQNLPKSYGVSR